MATSMKTICFPFPPLASITDATVTNFTQITLDLPEGSKVFKKAWVEAMTDDIVTVTGGTVGEWRLGLQLNASGYTTVTNTNDITNSGENMSPFFSADFTSVFTASWSGTSMTCDLQIYVDQTTGTTLGQVNGSALLWVTYEYDDTSSTMVGNAWIPFDSPLSAWGTSKSVNYSFPNLDTFLGYGSLSYKHIMVIAEGNEAVAGSTTTFVLSVQMDTTTQQNTGNHVSALASDRYVRSFFNMMSGGSPIFTTNATHSLYYWVSTGAVGRMNHACLTMLVVFTYDATSSNAGNISLLLPMEISSPMGGTASTDAQRGSRELWIEEAATITTQASACRLHWEQIGAISTLNARCGSQSYASYTDTALAMCGGNVLQRTCNDNITFARGRNTLTIDVYRSDTTDLGWNVSGLWIVNYKCAKPTNGWGRANHTVVWNLATMGTAAASSTYTVSSTAVTIPETTYFINALGTQTQVISSSTTTMYAYNVFAERLSGEGGGEWEIVYINSTHTDPEVGLFQFYSQMRTIFLRWVGDPDTSRIDIETGRRWRIYSGQNSTAYWTMNVYMTYHAITFTVSGTVGGSAGGTVNLYLRRATTDNALLLTGTRSGNGSYSFTWFDNTENVFVDALEDTTHLGRSENSTATGTP
jgi:hypothetical protein